MNREKKLIIIIISLIIFGIGGFLIWKQNQTPQLTTLNLPNTGQPLPEDIPYHLEATINHLPSSAMVYRFFSQSITTEDVAKLAKHLGFKSTTSIKAKERYSLIEDNSFLFVEKDGRFVFLKESALSDQEADLNIEDWETITLAEKYAKELGIWGEELILGEIGGSNVSYGPGNTKLISKTVNFIRTVEGYRVWGSSGISIDIGASKELKAVRYFSKDIRSFRKYILKGVIVALKEISVGKWSIAISPDATEAVVKSVELGYWEDPGSILDQPFMQPIYVFKGEAKVNGAWEPFIAFVPAVDDKYLR